MELDIGKQCELQSCRQLDYCPFLCNLCKKYYCINHRKPDGHECDKIDEVNVVTPIPKELPKLKVLIDNKEMAYVDIGSGETMLFLHGMLCCK